MNLVVLLKSVSPAGEEAIKDFVSRSAGFFAKKTEKLARKAGLSQVTSVVSEEPYVVSVTVSGKGRSQSYLGLISDLNVRREISQKLRQAQFSAQEFDDYVIEVLRE